MDNIEKLLLLQKHDISIRAMKEELREIPERKNALLTRLQTAQEQIAKTMESDKQFQTAIRMVELEIEAKRQKIAKLRQQQYELKTNEEFRAMEGEIQGVEREISSLEDRVLTLMEEFDRARADASRMRAELTASEKAAEEERAILDSRLVATEAKLSAARETREKIAQQVDAVWLSRYASLMERRDRAVVPITNGVCGGCHMRLPPQVVHNARRRTEMVFCNHCGRLLYE